MTPRPDLFNLSKPEPDQTMTPPRETPREALEHCVCNEQVTCMKHEREQILERMAAGVPREGDRQALHLLDCYRADFEKSEALNKREVDGLAAYRSRLVEQGRALGLQQAWQPIETAPKDGTPVLVYDDGAICLAAFDAISGFWIDVTAMEPAPTLWQPLPAPPVGAKR